MAGLGSPINLTSVLCKLSYLFIAAVSRLRAALFSFHSKHRALVDRKLVAVGSGLCSVGFLSATAVNIQQCFLRVFFFFFVFKHTSLHYYGADYMQSIYFFYLFLDISNCHNISRLPVQRSMSFLC